MNEYLDYCKEAGKIIVADDQEIMIESLKSSIKNLGLIEQAEFYQNGQQVIDRVKQLTQNALKEAKFFPICPVRVLLLDF